MIYQINIHKNLSEEVYDKNIKARHLSKIIENSDAITYFIEDDHNIIRATNETLTKVKTNHVSTLIV